MWNQSKSETTLLWYDYETWGVNPQRDRLAQFAAIRTNLALEPIGEPINLLCQPSVDTLIDPGAVLITGLSPLTLKDQGLNEWQFAQQIYRHMSLPGTCTTGYNTIRFDDECTRFLFWRNLLDPYAREWQNGNSRWDILDVVRMTKALRPEGIDWPQHEDGSPSFKLEHLTAANGISHEQAHDAVSDVKATIALAKLILDRQPKLFSYAFELRSKHKVRQAIDFTDQRPHLHFTGKIPAREHCLGVEVPLMMHPERNNEVIVIDIRQDPSWLLQHSAEDIRTWLYTPSDLLPAGIERPPLKTIHINRSPMIAPFSLLDDATAERLGLDRASLLLHQKKVAGNGELNELARQVFAADGDRPAPADAEWALYSGFVDDHDRNLLNKMASENMKPEDWLHNTSRFHDDRIPPLVENALARHFPDTLTDGQLSEWTARRQAQLNQKADDQALSIRAALEKAAILSAQYPENNAMKDTLTYLQSFAQRWQKATVTETAEPETKGLAESSDSDTPPPDLNQLDLFQ